MSCEAGVSLRDEKLYEEIARRLQEWCATKCRKYPWRQKSDPYVILVTEFLLQRTRSDSIAEIFDEFFSRYRSIWELASAKPEELSSFFSKLGLLYRGERILRMAQEIVEKYKGMIPCNAEKLLKIKGVGVYIASAVLNFGYNVPTPVVDKNVMRVMNRLFNTTREKECWEIISRLYKFGDNRLIAYALIDLGSMICKKRPLCEECPLNDVCTKYPLRQKEWRLYRKVLRGGRITLQEQPIH
jgi:A/G-specific adenine glycosylase